MKETAWATPEYVYLEPTEPAKMLPSTEFRITMPNRTELFGKYARFCIKCRKSAIAARGRNINQWFRGVWSQSEFTDRCVFTRFLWGNCQFIRKFQHPQTYRKIFHRIGKQQL